jgi:hypothetical protein
MSHKFDAHQPGGCGGDADCTVSINNIIPLTELLLAPGANSFITMIIREIRFMTLKSAKEVKS